MKDSGQREQHTTGAVRDVRTGKGRYDLISPVALRRLAVLLEKGAQKYAERNWEKGMPMSRFFDSCVRHLYSYLNGMRDEDHLAAAMWNVHCMMHFEELRPELNDMPIPATEIKPVPQYPVLPLKLNACKTCGCTNTLWCEMCPEHV